MAAPFPYEARSGRANIDNLALQLYGNYVWLARWSDEMNTDARLDLKKLAQFAFVHCTRFRSVYEKLAEVGVASVKDAVRSVFALKNCTWPDDAAMIADLTAIYNACGTAKTWVDANIPEAKTFASRTFDADGQETEIANVIDKPQALATRVGAFRALFV